MYVDAARPPHVRPSEDPLSIAAVACARLLSLGDRSGLWCRCNHQGMRRPPETILRNVVPQRIGIQALASFDGITRIRRCGGRGRHSENRPQQYKQASHKHLRHSLKRRSRAADRSEDPCNGEAERSTYGPRTARWSSATGYWQNYTSDRYQRNRAGPPGRNSIRR